MNCSVIGLDIAKNVFHFYGMNEDGEVIKQVLKRKQVLEYFANRLELMIGIEACAGAHYWARELEKLGHRVKLLHPNYVRPFVKGNKTDFNDAEGIYDAVNRPNMRSISVKSVEQQDIQMVHRIRQELVKRRTALVNQIRGLLHEQGIVISQGINQVRKRVPEILEDGENGLSELGRELFAEQYERLRDLDEQVAAQDQRISRLHRADRRSARFGEVPGIGPITATIVSADLGDGGSYRSGREYAASLGLVPRQHSSGGKPHLLGISKRGNRYIRTLLIHGSRSVIRAIEGKTDPLSRWLQGIKARRGANVAAVALANKNARILWALATRAERYSPAS